MAVSEYELNAILDHCRSLIDAADQFEESATHRTEKARIAKAKWEGPFRGDFNFRLDEELADLANRARAFRSEADQWAQIWADTVNEMNERRRESAINEISSRRGFGESFVDVFVGDDSHEQVRPHEPVTVPTAESRYSATGGLEMF